jgi:CheY-like chemotaxis protein
MSPKKVVLCAGADEQRMSLRVFLLETRGYGTLTATTAKEALAVLDSLGKGIAGQVDCLIVDLPLPGLEADTLVQARRLHPQLRTLATNNHAGWYDYLGVDVLLPKGADSNAELLERLRILVRRKPGPKKEPVVDHTLKPFGVKSEGVHVPSLVAARRRRGAA